MGFRDFIIFQAVMFAASLLCIFVPRNGVAGVRFFYTLADDEIWKAVNVRFGIAASCVVAVFALAGAAADFAGAEEFIYFAVAEAAAYGLVALYAYALAKKLYFKKFPDSPGPKGRAAGKSGFCAPKKMSGFERALFIFYIFATAALFFWLRGLCGPVWDETVATHWNAEGVVDGYMKMGDNFAELSAILLSIGALGVVGGYAASRLCSGGRGIFTPLSCGLSFALALTFFWATAVYSTLAAHENSGKLEIFSGLGGVFAAAGGAFLIFHVCASIGLSISLQNRAAGGRK